MPFLNMWKGSYLNYVVPLSVIMDLSEKKEVLFDSSFIFTVCGVLPSEAL